ncbi:MAG: ABC transporter ATP-binding protein [Kosmotoga sp.]|nr:MAG: ABC transporter ATP-binding protein [Kosmotoga sp.]
MIKTRKLTKRFGDLIAVEELDLDVYPGEIYGFLGPNGAGKTTTIKMLTGVLKPDSGSIEILNMDMSSNEMSIKKRIGVVPDEPRMYDNLKGYEFAKFIMEIYKVDVNEVEKRLNDICNILGIDYLNKFIGDYSHGMKQKLMVATVLMRQPEVIFLDEPTVGLDARSAKLLKLLLRKMANNNTTIFMTTHVLEVAEKMCDRIGIINEGELIAEGTMEELRQVSNKGNKSLEDLFLELTGGDEFYDIIDQLD